MISATEIPVMLIDTHQRTSQMPWPMAAGISLDADGASAPSDVHFFISPPDEVRLSRGTRSLELVWPGRTLRFDFAELRRACRCANCTTKRRVCGQIEAANDIDIVAIQPLGTGALQFIFSDGHVRGIYPWPYFAEIAFRHEANGV
jgi:DUF971 family protein